MLMGTNIRPELSERNSYWIERHRFYELKHFCLQYPTWRKTHAALGTLSSIGVVQAAPTKKATANDPVGDCVEARAYYAQRMELINDTVIFAAGDLSDYLLLGVTTGASYDHLRVKHNIPCGKDTYYSLYRRFFWLLDKTRN